MLNYIVLFNQFFCDASKSPIFFTNPKKIMDFSNDFHFIWFECFLDFFLCQLKNVQHIPFLLNYLKKEIYPQPSFLKVDT